MAPKKRTSKKRASRRNDLTTDGTPSPGGNLPVLHRGVPSNRPRPRMYGKAPTSCENKLETGPPKRPYWERGIYDPTFGSFFRLSWLVSQNRLPREFKFPGRYPYTGEKIREHLWRCKALGKNVPWDVCLAACSVAQRQQAVNTSRTTLAASDMPLVAAEMESVWRKAKPAERTLYNYVQMRRMPAFVAAATLMQLSRADRRLATDWETAQRPDGGDVEMVSTTSEIMRSDEEHEDIGAVPIAPVESSEKLSSPKTGHISKAKAAFTPRRSRSAVERSKRDSKSAPSATARPAAAVSRHRVAPLPVRYNSPVETSRVRTRSTPARKRKSPKPSKPHAAGKGDYEGLPWSEEELEMLYVLRGDQGWSWKCVCLVLGRSNQGCRLPWCNKGMTAAYDNGTASRAVPWSDQDEQRVVALRDQSNPTIDWTSIGADAALSMSRTARACELRYVYVKHRMGSGPPQPSGNGDDRAWTSDMLAERGVNALATLTSRGFHVRCAKTLADARTAVRCG